MAEDPNKRDFRGRKCVAGEEDYAVQYVAEQNDIRPQQTRELIERFGNDRGTLEFEAKKLKAG